MLKEEKSMNRIVVDSRLCKGCSLCVAVCPKKIIEIDARSLNEKGYNTAKVTEMEKCLACCMCAIMCPDSAISVEKEAAV